MTILPIIWAPDPTLKAKCSPILEVDAEIRLLIENMLQTMYQAAGIGLAAPQVGVKKRIIVVDCAPSGEKPQPLRMINPEIISVSEEKTTKEEGCLSLPTHYAEITRPESITIKYLDEDGTSQKFEAGGILSTCIQHEIDHLNGILFVDHLSTLKRNMILKKMVKAKKDRYESKSE